MTRDEAVSWLHRAKWVLVDMGHTMEAGDVERAEVLVFQRHVTLENLRTYADDLVPPGRRGRCALVLRQPAEARARAMTAAVLRAVEDG